MSSEKKGGKVLGVVMLIVGLLAGGVGGYMAKDTDTAKGIEQAAKRGELGWESLQSQWKKGGWNAVKKSFEKQPDLGAKILLLELTEKDEQVLSTVRRRAAESLSAGEARFLLKHLPETAGAGK